jgi:hypothetical protein
MSGSDFNHFKHFDFFFVIKILFQQLDTLLYQVQWDLHVLVHRGTHLILGVILSFQFFKVDFQSQVVEDNQPAFLIVEPDFSFQEAHNHP